MKMRKISFTIPADLAEHLGEPEVLAAKARKGFLLELVRDAEISSGKAAELLGITRWDMLDLMGEYCIPMGLRTEEDVDREFEAARRVSQDDGHG
jgi:hypothetical protein